MGACIEGFQLTAQWINQPAIVETDSLALSQAINGSDQDRSLAHGILKGIPPFNLFWRELLRRSYKGADIFSRCSPRLFAPGGFKSNLQPQSPNADQFKAIATQNLRSYHLWALQMCFQGKPNCETFPHPKYSEQLVNANKTNASCCWSFLNCHAQIHFANW